MKFAFYILFLIGCSCEIQSQSLFFDSLPNSNWKSTIHLNDSIIRKTKTIGLYKTRQPFDSLKQETTVWSFKEYIVVVKYLNPKIKKDSLIAAYRYEIDREHGLFKLILEDESKLEYTVGITSVGNFAILYRKKEKRKRNKTS